MIGCDIQTSFITYFFQALSSNSVEKKQPKKILKMDGKHMINILGFVEQFFIETIQNTFKDIDVSTINTSIQVSRVADYQCNAALNLAKVSFL